MTRRPQPPTRRRPLRGLAATAALVFVLGGVREVSQGSAAPDQPSPTWQTSQPVPIAVTGGHAQFRVPTPTAGSRTLVIVSALARGAGLYPVRLTARSVDPGACDAPEVARSGPKQVAQTGRPTLPPIAPPPTAMPPRDRSFYLMAREGDVGSASNYLRVEGRLRAVGRRVQVYVDAADLAAVGPTTLTDVVSTFDDRIFPIAAHRIGQARDVDSDGRFTVLMSSWLTRLAGGRHAVDGFVRGADLDLSLPAPFSNRCDMMYLSTALTSGPHLRTVMAHEYTHAVTFCARKSVEPKAADVAPEEDGWLDEALAHLVEDLHGFSRSNLDYRVSAFLSQPERYRLVVDDYYAADLFRSHGNRGSTYLFLRWLADRFGPDLLPTLVTAHRHGVDNIEAATGQRFADLYRAWTLALYFSGLDPAQPEGARFRDIDLRGPLADFELAGPRTVPVHPDGPPASWASAGTASRFLVVEPSHVGGVEITVEGPPEADLQVTAVPLPEDLPRLDLSIRSGQDSGLVVGVAASGGQPVRLSSVSWEPLVPAPDPHAPGFRRDALRSRAIVAGFGTDRLTPGTRLASQPIPARDAMRSRSPLVVKVVGTDALGRRVAGWAELDPTARDALATHPREMPTR